MNELSIEVLNTNLMQAKSSRIIELVDEVNEMEESMQQGQRAMVLVAAQVGAKLIEIKKLLPHGEFTSYIEEHCVVSPKQIRIYMRVAENKPEYIEYDMENNSNNILLSISEIVSNTTKKTKVTKPDAFKTVKKLWDKLTPEERVLITGIVEKPWTTPKREQVTEQVTEQVDTSWLHPTPPDPKLVAEIDALEAEDDGTIGRYGLTKKEEAERLEQIKIKWTRS